MRHCPSSETSFNGYGIDAHVEPKTNGVPSGRPVALQIKTGQSYFKPTQEGWRYRAKGNERHLHYWLGHTLPVLIIFCDPDTETLYWQHVTAERINYTPNDWTIVIPRNQTITPDAKDAITAIAYAAVGATEDPLGEMMPFLPPSVADAIRRVAASEPRGALRLAVALARGRHAPRLAVETIMASRPSWLERGGGQFEAVLGAYSVEHGHPDLAARAFTLAAEQVGATAGRLHALAAVFTAGTGDLSRAAELLEHAEAAGGPPVLLAAVSWYLRRLDETEQVPVPEALQAASPQELASEPMCLLILGEDAGNRRDISGVVSYAEQALAAGPDNSGLQLRMSEALLWRVTDGSAAVPAEDLRRAEDLATTARQQRRRWSGPSGQALTVLLRKHLLAGAYTTMINLATPSPRGQASEQEAGEGNVAYLGAIAALALGQRDETTEFVDRVDGTPIAVGLRALVADPDLPRDEQIRLWRQALPVIDQHALRLRGLYRLAALGAWPFPELDQARESGVLDPATADLLAARSEAARGNVQAAVMWLRRHVATSAAAVELLVEVENDGQYGQALQECARGIARFGEVVLDAMRLNLLLRSDQRDAAADSAVQLLSRTDLPAERRLALRRGLIGFYTMRADWVNVETHSRAALGDHPEQADLQWALIGATVNQGRLDDAWTRFRQLTPPIIHRGALGVWMGLHAQFGFTEADITIALDSLPRWPDDPEVGAQILATLMHAGRPPDSARSRRGWPAEIPRCPPGLHHPLSRRSDPRDQHRRAELRRDDARPTGTARRAGSAAGEPGETGSTAPGDAGRIPRPALRPGADPTRLRADCGNDIGPCSIRPGNRRRECLAQPVGSSGDQRVDHGHAASCPMARTAGCVRRTRCASQRSTGHPDHRCRAAPRSRQPELDRI